MRKIVIILAVWASALLAPQPAGAEVGAQGAAAVTPAPKSTARFDEEHIVDVSRLKEKLAESTEPLKERIEKSQLQQKFDGVFKVLEQKEVDNKKLKSSLAELEQGIGSFRSNWEGIANPLWKGQVVVGETISKIRTLVAASCASQTDAKSAKELAVYDAELSRLAKGLSAETDPRRKERMKLLFQNLYNLRQIKSVKVNLAPASQLLMARMIGALERLELQFTRIIFASEEAYAVLGNQQRFVGEYIQVLNGLMDIEDLSAWLAGSGAADGVAAVEGLLGHLKELGTSVSGFESAMNDYSQQLLENIEDHTRQIEAKMDSVAPQSTSSGADLDKLIKEYAKKGGVR